MALTATATKGFEKHRTVESDEVFLVPGNPGTTYDVGDLCTIASAVLTKITANQAPMFRVAKKVVVPANTQAFPNPKMDTLVWSGDTDAAKTLVPVEPLVPQGTRVLRCTFKDHLDDTVASYSAASRYIGLGTGAGADDRPNNALIYVYEGTGAGQINIITDYDHTGGTVELMASILRPFATDLDTTSKVIILSGEAATNKGIGPFGLCGAADEDEIECDNHADDGTLRVFADWRELPGLLKKLQLPVVGAHLFA